MSGISTILISVVLFLMLITVHEFGHFAVAKLTGIKVNEFSVGMGPTIAKKQKGETLYALRALPIGGYCAMEGEDESSEDSRAFSNAKPWKKFLTILAGPMMNILIAVIIFSIVATMSTSNSKIVGEVIEGSPAENAGILSGDELVSIEGKKLEEFEDLSKAVTDSNGKEITIEILRDGDIKDYTLTPQLSDGRYIIGVSSKQVPFKGNPIKEGFMTSITILKLLWNFIIEIFTGKVGLDSVSGPVGVVAAISTAAKSGISTLLFFFGYISMNLAFFNLLPIPALDGSQLVYIIIEKLRGKPLKTETIGKINFVGLMVLLLLIFIVSIKDIINLFG